MKWRWMATMLAVTVLGCAEGVERVVISVPGIMCEESCTVATREILMAQPGVREVDVRFETKTATVVINEELFRVDDAIAALDDHGFADSRVVGDAAL